MSKITIASLTEEITFLKKEILVKEKTIENWKSNFQKEVAKPNFSELMNKELRKKRFDTNTSGTLRITRSIIPSEIVNKIDVHIDENSLTSLAAFSLRLRISPDEFIRKFIWCFTENEKLLELQK